ncbi:hypothetical protein CPC08DRAFT_620538, partial [Agrocybe pediades]
PAWFVKLIAMFKSESLGPQWSSLISSYSKFEAAHGYEGAAKLKSRHRPSMVGDWINRARPSTSWRPNIRDISKLADEFMKWWSSLQPQWRVGEDGVILFKQKVGDWDSLRKPGLNGLLSVVAGLFYW